MSMTTTRPDAVVEGPDGAVWLTWPTRPGGSWRADCWPNEGTTGARVTVTGDAAVCDQHAGPCLDVVAAYNAVLAWRASQATTGRRIGSRDCGADVYTPHGDGHPCPDCAHLRGYYRAASARYEAAEDGIVWAPTIDADVHATSAPRLYPHNAIMVGLDPADLPGLRFLAWPPRKETIHV